MAHSHGGRVCEYPTKKACIEAQRESLGRCAELIGDQGEKACRNWAVDRVNGHPVCGQHYASAMLREREAAKLEARRVRLDAQFEAHMTAEAARIEEGRRWWREHATPRMRTAHALTILQSHMRDVDSIPS